MALSIKNEEAERLAKELAREKGTTVKAFAAAIVVSARKGAAGVRELDLLLRLRSLPLFGRAIRPRLDASSG